MNDVTKHLKQIAFGRMASRSRRYGGDTPLQSELISICLGTVSAVHWPSATSGIHRAATYCGVRRSHPAERLRGSHALKARKNGSGVLQLVCQTGVDRVVASAHLEDAARSAGDYS